MQLPMTYHNIAVQQFDELVATMHLIAGAVFALGAAVLWHGWITITAMKRLEK